MGKPVTGPELRAIRDRLGLTQEQMAQQLNTPYKTYQGWEIGRRQSPGCLVVALRVLEFTGDGGFQK